MLIFPLFHRTVASILTKLYDGLFLTAANKHKFTAPSKAFFQKFSANFLNA
jgi:hypothetical protein